MIIRMKAKQNKFYRETQRIIRHAHKLQNLCETFVWVNNITPALSETLNNAVKSCESLINIPNILIEEIETKEPSK